MLAKGFCANLRGRTPRCEVHQTWKGNDPAIHCINNVATVELERLALDTWVTENGTGLTKRPSVSQPFRKIRISGAMVIALELMRNRYPSGPGGDASSPGNYRLSMEETD